jgi:DNA modification methylase
LADDLTDAQIKAFRLLVNQSANWADWDEGLLKIELEELAALDFDLDLTGFDFDEINQYLQNTEDAEPFEEEKFNLPKEDKAPISKTGDLWLLGNHRLLCGDSLDPENYVLLLENNKADITVCDPPYNVNYGASFKDTIRNKTRQNQNKIVNDNLGDSFPEFLNAVCRNIIENTKGAIYICMAASELHVLQKAFVENNGHWSTFIIWAKNHFSLSRSDYQRQYEPILYSWSKNAERHWCGDRNQSDIWQINKPTNNALHPTMKPFELMARAIKNSSKENDLVLDHFGGSGTTLMEAESTHRRCAMMELEPKYVDTIIERWQGYSKKEAILVRTNQTYSEISKYHGTDLTR